MTDYAKVNKKWWNDVTPIHAGSKLYNLTEFKKGKNSLFSIEQEELGDVRGKTILHLLCHFGMDTLSWARMGAKVTGVDISDQSIRLAKKLSNEVHLPAKFICSDVYDLPHRLHEKFDIIFMSYGVLCWLSNIKKFAKIIQQYLSNGGVFYIAELHPFTNILSYDFRIDYRYFDNGPNIDDSSGTYADWEADIHSPTYLWNHTISEVMNALIHEGLKIEYLHEFPYTMYEQFPGLMKQNEKGHYVFKDRNIQIPLLFSLKAIK